MIIFNGNERAAERLQTLRAQTVGKQFKIAAILFAEDAASKLYTRLKSEAATQVEIAYDVYEFSLTDGTIEIEDKIAELNADPTVTGIIIQKPYRTIWVQAKGIDTTQSSKDIRQAYTSWWRFLTSRIALEKDVDGLHPTTLAAIENNTWLQQGLVMPATAQAVMLILDEAFVALEMPLAQQSELTMCVLGRSDIVGLPVWYELKNRGYKVSLLTRDELEARKRSGKGLTDFQVIISATGVKHLLTNEMIAEGSIVIDVGEPAPDLDPAAHSQTAFVTPVPGGVGPMTVVCLLENCVKLATAKISIKN